jgi:hypothetical protein
VRCTSPAHLIVIDLWPKTQIAKRFPPSPACSWTDFHAIAAWRQARRVLQSSRTANSVAAELIAATIQYIFTLLIKIFGQSRLISNILPTVKQIDCTDPRIIFSLHILLLSTSFLILILLLQGERSGHKREWHKSTWRRYRSTTKERRLFTGWKDFKVRSTAGRCLLSALCCL